MLRRQLFPENRNRIIPHGSGAMTVPGYMRVQPDGIVLSLKVQPRASASEIGDSLGNELRVKVTAPPVEAAANEALTRLLSDELGIPRNRIELLRGHTSRHKLVKIHGVSAESLLQTLQKPATPPAKGHR